MNDFIEVYDNALPDHICDIAVRKTDYKCETGGVGYIFSNEKQRKDDNIILNSHGKTLSGFNKLRDDLVAYLRPCVEKYSLKYQFNVNFTEQLFPSFKIKRAKAGGGFSAWHHEQGNKQGYAERFLVWMYYLNDVDESGTTDFMFQKRSIVPKKGSCVVFPASFTHRHRGNPKLNQDKYIVGGWFNYKN